ncbi:MAG TPA: hypothetical protein PLO61_05170 [Fimbriimonadaceae bacterium]|nr:hypothetical protein [Fimbriimonadaceae bacterium]HRJ32607.1 hypothetical protein [Fimbriimonadaceae bacterium]
MKIVFITQDPEVRAVAERSFPATEELHFFENWSQGLEACQGATLLYVDQEATLESPHKIAGYERFAEAKMGHPVAGPVKVVLISPPSDYELDFVVGWPDFLFQRIGKPLTKQQVLLPWISL